MRSQPLATLRQNVVCGLLGAFVVVAGTGHLLFARRAVQSQVPN